MPTVSVIIPTYNHARFIAQAVESTLAQTYSDLEIIVVDDGSTDDTQAILASYGDCTRRVRVIHKENRGVAAARNTGILAAQGDYLLFLDADDLIPANKLECKVPILNAQPNVGLVYSAFQYIDEGGTQVLHEIRPQREGHLLKDLLLRRLFFPPGAAVVRRECLDQVGIFDETCSAAADTDMWIRIAQGGFPFGYVDQPLFQYRVVKGSMSGNIVQQAGDEFARLDKFFGDPDLPSDTKALEPKAYSILHYEFAAKHYHAGEIKIGQQHIRRAITTCPRLAGDEEWLLEWIAGYALGPQVEDPHGWINLMFDHLPPEATTLRQLRRRAHGRYHAAAAFSAQGCHSHREVRQHILPALTGDPTLIRNRGFLRIAAESLLRPG